MSITGASSTLSVPSNNSSASWIISLSNSDGESTEFQDIPSAFISRARWEYNGRANIVDMKPHTTLNCSMRLANAAVVRNDHTSAASAFLNIVAFFTTFFTGIPNFPPLICVTILKPTKGFVICPFVHDLLPMVKPAAVINARNDIDNFAASKGMFSNGTCVRSTKRNVEGTLLL